MSRGRFRRMLHWVSDARGNGDGHLTVKNAAPRCHYRESLHGLGGGNVLPSDSTSAVGMACRARRAAPVLLEALAVPPDRSGPQARTSGSMWSAFCRTPAPRPMRLRRRIE